MKKRTKKKKRAPRAKRKYTVVGNTGLKHTVELVEYPTEDQNISL